jgi:hypothetical protein
MSHSTFIVDDEEREWTFIHNGDWSGPVDIRRISGKRGVTPESERRIEESYRIPGEIIRQASAGRFVSDLIGVLEGWDGSTEAADRMRDALVRKGKKP